MSASKEPVHGVTIARVVLDGLVDCRSRGSIGRMPPKRSPAKKPAGKKAPPKAPKMPKAGPKTVERFEALAEGFVARGARRSQMFGMPVLKVGDKVFAGTFGDAMTFKLGPEDLEQARTQSGVASFEPMKGRPMREWVLVPLAHAKRWQDLAERAFSYLK